jgi:hypothetical protein
MSETRERSGPSTVTLHLAYAEASVMLIEALMRLLIERNVLPKDCVIEMLETTVETKRLLAQSGDHAEISRIAAGVLSTIANSVAAGGGQWAAARATTSFEGGSSQE